MGADTLRAAEKLLHMLSGRRWRPRGGGGVGEMLDVGVDVALITVQVETVTGIDCASKCCASHLSFFFFFSFFKLRPRYYKAG